MPHIKKKSLFFFFMLFIAVYLLPGIYGHTPWKQDENYSFGIIQTMHETGNWLVPTNAGEPFMEKPPLYYWTATLLTYLLHPLLPLHDAARTASLLFSIVNFSFFILLARRVYQTPDFRDSRIWVAFALYISAPGLLRHSHDMFTDVALTCGAIIALYGIQGLILQQKQMASTVWLSVGTAIAMLTKGLFIPAILWATLLICPLFLAECRRKRFWYPVILAGILALIMILPWPLRLFLNHPELFMDWFWDNNVGRFIGFSVEKLGAKATFGRIPEAIALFALPSGLLAVCYFLRHPLKRLRSPVQCPLTLFTLLGIVLLQMSSSSRALYLLPFIAPMALLATPLFSAIPPMVLKRLSSFSAGLWSLFIALVWLLYLTKLTSPDSPWLADFDKGLPGSYHLSFSWLAVCIGLLITLLWLGFIRYAHELNAALRAAFSWGLGITCSWGVIFSLLVGWIDYSKGYQTVFTDLKQHIAGTYQPDDCMASYGIDESEAPMLYYYTDILHHRQLTFSKPQTCQWLIVLGNPVRPAPAGMTLFWQGHRPGETHETLAVYHTLPPSYHTPTTSHLSDERHLGHDGAND